MFVHPSVGPSVGPSVRNAFFSAGGNDDGEILTYADDHALGPNSVLRSSVNVAGLLQRISPTYSQSIYPPISKAISVYRVS